MSGLEVWLKWKSTWLASVKPSSNHSSQKKKKKSGPLGYRSSLRKKMEEEEGKVLEVLLTFNLLKKDSKIILLH
jgi:hypothetical protein